MNAAFHACYQDLALQDARAYRLLAQCPDPGFDAAACALLAADTDETAGVLERLIDAGLLDNLCRDQFGYRDLTAGPAPRIIVVPARPAAAPRTRGGDRRDGLFPHVLVAGQGVGRQSCWAVNGRPVTSRQGPVTQGGHWVLGVCCQGGETGRRSGTTATCGMTAPSRVVNSQEGASTGRFFQ
ncbi:MAG: hypothetical protein JWN52_5012 [Actinomycetia bacterium]|nr:hypothetical protein [Actinomycetes bacterium]